MFVAPSNLSRLQNWRHEGSEQMSIPCGRFISSEHSPMAEELLKLENTRFKCKNTKDGCREFLQKEAMISHEMGCIYRSVKCPHFNCESKVPFHELTAILTVAGLGLKGRASANRCAATILSHITTP